MSRPAHQERVIAEQHELEDKLEKLIAFLHSTFYKDHVVQSEKERLERQFTAMTDYNEVLKERIINFED